MSFAEYVTEVTEEEVEELGFPSKKEALAAARQRDKAISENFTVL